MQQDRTFSEAQATFVTEGENPFELLQEARDPSQRWLFSPREIKERESPVKISLPKGERSGLFSLREIVGAIKRSKKSKVRFFIVLVCFERERRKIACLLSREKEKRTGSYKSKQERSPPVGPTTEAVRDGWRLTVVTVC